MLSDKHTRNAHLFSEPYDHVARGVPAQDALAGTPLWPPSDGHFTRRPEQSDYPANEGWKWQEDIQAWAYCHHVMSPMGFKRQKPSQHDEPPIPGLSPSSEPAEDIPTCEPEPEVAPTQSTEEPFGKQLLQFFNSSPLFLTPPSPVSSSSHHYPLGHHH
ncbi:hypothetical protein O181_027295 [Austropuccinia psidii MF-1]|uniref:Uncharacterized protein n=1 Tax=Austropuccinia psidii MF-1 TaxID=1389203 RepID=A0A9Q3CR49_9BASI|nr:hypothetical protein [Austropuccinia psidii MF-1]